MKDLFTGDLTLRGVYREMGADDPARIDELERLTGYTLPPDYREFLLHFAPSTFVRSICYRPLESRGREPYQIPEVFFGFNKGDMYDVIGNFQSTSGMYPANMIPFSFDPGANKILIALDEPAGRIYYQDKFTGKLYLCALSLRDFFARCMLDPEYENLDDGEDEVFGENDLPPFKPGESHRQ